MSLREPVDCAQTTVATPDASMVMVRFGRLAPLELMASVEMPPREPRQYAATLEDVFVALTGRHLRDE